jgi:hypothetical protein
MQLDLRLGLVMPKEYGTGLGARTPYLRHLTLTESGWANLYFNLDQQVGWSNGTNSVYTNNSGTDYVTHLSAAPPASSTWWRIRGRVPQARTVPHNLGVAPELIIAKT